MKDKTTAALLAFFLGGFGAHKFYLDQTGKGLLYFLFSWTFIPAFVAFFEFFMFLFMNQREFNRKYNNRLPAGDQQHMLPADQSTQTPQTQPPSQSKSSSGETPQQMGQNITVNVEGDEGAGTGVADELEKLHNLKESGALTEEEFQQQKQKLLSDD